MVQVYFMDTYMWYAMFSTFIGGISGAWHRIGEVSEADQYVSTLITCPIELKGWVNM
jgi:hypothetical protein